MKYYVKFINGKNCVFDELGFHHASFGDGIYDAEDARWYCEVMTLTSNLKSDSLPSNEGDSV